jgi:hypothetical protein
MKNNFLRQLNCQIKIKKQLKVQKNKSLFQKNLSNFTNKLLSYDSKVFYIITYMIVLFNVYILIYFFNSYEILKLIILSIFILPIVIFISENYKLSNNKIIKTLQVFVAIFVILRLIIYFLYLFEINIFEKTYCDSDDDVASLNAIKKNIEDINKIAYTNEDPSNQITCGGTSPTYFDGGFISSILEENEIPLITIVNGLSVLNYIEFSLIIALFSVLFRKLILKNVFKIISSFKAKIDDDKASNIKNKNVDLSKELNPLDQFSKTLVLLLFIALILFKLLHLFFSFYFAENIDSFVIVYNYIKNKSNK